MIGWSLAALSVVCGLAITVAFSRLADLAALRAARNRVQAHLLEIRLFSAEPRLVLRAQASLVRANVRLLGVLAGPVFILTLPMAWIWVQFDSAYGFAPLPLGQPAIVTVQMSNALAPDDRNALEAPPGIAVESQPVRSFADRQVSWRVRPTEPVRGDLRVTSHGRTIEKAVAAGERGVFLLPRRSSSFFEWLLRPEERRLPEGEVEWIEVQYPKADVTLAGIALHWIAWFLSISTVSAFLFARWLRVPL